MAPINTNEPGNALRWVSIAHIRSSDWLKGVPVPEDGGVGG